MPVTYRLHLLLKHARLSQRECARRAGLSPTTVNRLCKASRTRGAPDGIALETLDALCAVLTRALGRPVTPGELFAPQPRRPRGAPRVRPVSQG